MARVLLLLPTSTYRSADFIAAARRLDVEVVIGSDHRLAIAPALADGGLVVDFATPRRGARRIVEHCRSNPVDAIVAVDDEGVLVAAAAGEQLGLPHNPVEAVAATRDKAALREALTACGLPQPAYRVASGDEDAAGLAEEVGWPCVLKPLSLSASRGVIRADDRAEAAQAAERVRRIIAESSARQDPRMLIESYIPGEEVAIEGVLRGGRLEILAIFDKPDPLEGPVFEETLYVTPSRKPSELLARIEARCAGAAAALGLSEGPIHAEARVHDSEVWVIEVAARSIGGLCSRSLRFGLGVSLEELLLRHALGLPLEDLRPHDQASGVMMLPIPAAGVLQEVRGIAEARATPGIDGVEITAVRGRPLRPLPEGDRYLGFLFARGATPAEVEEALRAAHSRLTVVTSELPDGAVAEVVGGERERRASL